MLIGTKRLALAVGVAATALLPPAATAGWGGAQTAARPVGGWFEFRFVGVDCARLYPRTFNDYATNHRHGISMSVQLVADPVGVGKAIDGDVVRVDLPADPQKPITSLQLVPGVPYKVSLVVVHNPDTPRRDSPATIPVGTVTC